MTVPGPLLRIFLLACACLILPAGTAFAQDDAQQRALKRAQFMLRQLNSEKGVLQAEKAALDEQVIRLESEVSRLAAELEQARVRSETLAVRFSERLESANDRIKRTDERLLEAVEKYRDAAARLADMTARGDELQGALEATRRELTDSESKNALLVEANLEMADRYADKGLARVLWEKEPVTGLRQVQVENILQEYRLRVENLDRGAEPPPLPEANGQPGTVTGQQGPAVPDA